MKIPEETSRRRAWPLSLHSSQQQHRLSLEDILKIAKGLPSLITTTTAQAAPLPILYYLGSPAALPSPTEECPFSPHLGVVRHGTLDIRRDLVVGHGGDAAAADRGGGAGGGGGGDGATCLLEGVAALAALLLDALLADVSEAVAAAEGGLHVGVAVDEASRDGLDDAEHLHGVADGADLGLAQLEDAEGDAEQRLAAFVEEDVPNAQRRLDGQGADEAAHEPRRHAQRDGRQPVGGAGEGGRRPRLGPAAAAAQGTAAAAAAAVRGGR